MCGIAGVIGDSNSDRSRADVSAMMSSLSHRGPDGEGLEQWPAATLGHRRLSIFDLSLAGRQPMISANGQVGLVFNGAIYNFIELRTELEQNGMRFRSRTDTEVLLHGYVRWGVDALVSRLRGMFAIAVWDSDKRKLYLIRDRLGVKPLLYVIHRGVLAFASTARALSKGGMAGGLDTMALTEFLEYGFVTDERSVFAGVKKVPPGNIGEWDGSHLNFRRYWALPRVESSRKVAFQDAVQETEKIICEAVKMRLQADVPVGSLLSGGIDSSLVCWAAASSGANVKTFTVGTSNDITDESADAGAIARQLGISHSAIHLSADDPPAIEDLVSAYSEPFACASALGMLRISRAVKREVTVLLTGDGGDDIFLGYPYHRHFLMAQRLATRMPRTLASRWHQWRRILPARGFLRRVKHFLDYSSGGLGAVIQTHDGLPLYHRFGLLGDRLANISLHQRQTPWSVKSAQHLLEEFLAYDWQTTFTGEYLTKLDGGTMYYGLEARSPFLDHVLWEYAGSVPLETRLQNGELKAILREIARKRIGPSVANRPKRGFEVPVCRWLAKQWGNEFQEIFNESLLAKEHFIRAEPVLDLWRRTAPSGKVPLQLWYLFVLENWMRAQFCKS
jgi:asparagine synthase (glutamine-hydrolysing)